MGEHKAFGYIMCVQCVGEVQNVQNVVGKWRPLRKQWKPCFYSGRDRMSCMKSRMLEYESLSMYDMVYNHDLVIR